MKRISFLLFCLIFAQLVSAQVKFISSNKEDMKILADSLVSLAKMDYVYFKTNESEYGVKIEYRNTEDESNRMYFEYNIRYVNANENLEMKGTPEYHFKRVSGKFLDIFPFWYKYIDSEYNQEDMSKKKQHYIIKDDKRYLIQNKNNIWSIGIYDVIK